MVGVGGCCRLVGDGIADAAGGEWFAYEGWPRQLTLNWWGGASSLDDAGRVAAPAAVR